MSMRDEQKEVNAEQKEEFSEEALSKFILDMLIKKQTVMRFLIITARPQGKNKTWCDELSKAIIKHFRIPEAVEFPEDKTWPANSAMTINLSSDNYKFGYNEAIRDCKEAYEKAKGKV